MNENDPEGSAPQAEQPASEPQSAAPPAHDAGANEGANEGAPAEGAAATDAGAGDAQSNDGSPDGGRRKKRRRGRGRGSDGPPGPNAGQGAPQHRAPSHAQHAQHGGHGGPQREGPGPRSYVEDRLDKDAEQLARDARSLPFSRLRPLGILAQEVRRMVATGDPRDAREARRALVLLKSRVAYLAGREQGKERSALVKVREFVFRGVDHVTRNSDAPDPEQLRNFLDGIEALVGYHRFHADDRRRD